MITPKQERTINLRRGEEVRVRCRRRRRDEGRRNFTRIIDLRPGEDVIVRCRRHH